MHIRSLNGPAIGAGHRPCLSEIDEHVTIFEARKDIVYVAMSP